MSQFNSNDPNYGRGAISGKGWQTRKFCDYPQSLTIEFPTKVKLKTLQFLSHEYKIASRVEIFFLPLNDPREVKVGHFSFENGYSV